MIHIQFTQFTAALLLLSTPALAQSDNGRPAQAPGQQSTRKVDGSAERYVSVETLEGAKCLVVASSGQGDEAREAKVVDMLIDSRSGELRWAVLSLSDRSVLVPARMLRWDAKQDCFQADVSEADLGRLEAFAPDADVELSLDRAVSSAEQRWQAMRAARAGGKPAGDDATAERRAQEAAAPMRTANAKYPPLASAHYRISQLDELELFGPEAELGSVTRSIVDRNTMRVEFFVVNTGPMGVVGDAYLLPFGAASISREAGDADAEPRLYADMSQSQLEASTPYEEPESGVLDEAAAARARATVKPMKKSADGHSSGTRE